MTRLVPVRRGRFWLVVAIAALVVVLAGGCGPIAATIDTQSALRDAGYQSVSVNFSVGNTDEIKVGVTVNAEPALSQADSVAHIVWNKFHERFSVLAVTVHGSGPAVSRDYSYSDLVSLFGPRNPAYDRTSLSSATTRLGAVIIVILVVLVAAVVVVVVLVTRRRRRRGPTWPPVSGGPWMQGGSPPPGGPPVWQGGPPPGWSGGSAPWSGVPQPPAAAGPHPPASYPLWPPPQGPPPQGQPPGGQPPAGQPPAGQLPAGQPPGGQTGAGPAQQYRPPANGGDRPEQAPVWPPAPSPPAGDD